MLTGNQSQFPNHIIDLLQGTYQSLFLQGTYSVSPGSPTCTNCPAGTSSSAIGATSSATCATCGQVGHENLTSLCDGTTPLRLYDEGSALPISKLAAKCFCPCGRCMKQSLIQTLIHSMFAIFRTVSTVSFYATQGTYSSSSAATCTNCPAGTSSSASGATSSGTCTPCGQVCNMHPTCRVC